MRARIVRKVGWMLAVSLLAPCSVIAGGSVLADDDSTIADETAEDGTPEEDTSSDEPGAPLPSEPVVFGDPSDPPLIDGIPLPEPDEWSSKGARPVRLEPLPEGVGPGTDESALFVPPADPVPMATQAARSVRLPGSGLTPVDADGRVRVGPGDPERGSSAPADVVASVVGSQPSTAIGMPGGAVKLSPAGKGGPVRVEFDLTYLVATSSVDVVDRVRVVSMPECVLTTPASEKCSVGTDVPFTVDAERGVVTAAGWAPASGSGGVVMGLMSTPTSESGSFAATTLKASSFWAVGDQTGGFSWSYPVPLSPSWFGPSVGVDLQYSSQSLDGLSDVENNQGDVLGLGWSIGAGGFIERSYLPCNQDTGGWAMVDMCWVSQNATINLDGRSSRLVPTGVSDEWRLEQDPNWIVKRLTGTTGSQDNDGERWEVRSPDGMLYTFGARPVAAQSVWAVPVYGNNTGEPCKTSSVSTSWCMQAWRWNLDQVIDTSGNTVDFNYFRQDNRYGRGGFPSQSTSYASGGWLQSIEYGKAASAQATNRVLFETAKRCLSNNTAVTACYWDEASRSTPYWPDRPSDLVCVSTTYCAGAAPVFFIEHVLKSVNAQTRTSAGAGWVTFHMTETKLEWPDFDAGGPEDPQLWLREIKQSGFSGGTLTLPPIRFESRNSRLDNRADAIDIFYWRIDEVADELGGVTTVTYQTPVCTPRSPTNPQWENNSELCFPMYTTLGSSSGFGSFNKFLVGQVRQTDNTMASTTPLVTTYQYLDGAAWHRDDNPLTPSTQRTYSDFRGFSRVRVVSGIPSDQLVTEKIYFRGMHGDLMPSPQSPRNVSVLTTSGWTVDDSWRKGLLAETRAIDAAGASMTYDLSTYGMDVTATGGGFVASRIKVTAVNTGVRQGAGWRETATQNTYTSDGFLQQTWERGDIATTADDRCTYRSYLAGTTALRGLVNGEQLFAGTCTGSFQSFTQYFYDGASSATAPPTRGILTRRRSFYTASAYLDTVYVPDSLGRIETVTNPRGFSTTTVFAPFNGYPWKVTNALGHTTENVEFNVGLGVATRIEDANDKQTVLGYDQFGRLVTVRKPGDAVATTKYEYSVTKIAPPFVKTTQEHQPGVSSVTWQYFDGLGRPRETQRPSPTLVGRIVSAVEYDTKGLQIRASDEFFDSSSLPGGGVLTAATFGTPPREERTTYDRLGRVSRSARYAAGSLLWNTDTAYDGWLTTVTPPVGGATKVEADAFGRTIKRTEYGIAPSGWLTNYTYTVRGELASATDAKGNVTSSVYDFLGRQTSHTDRDRGVTSYTYDANGNVSTATPATGFTETHYYDALDRPTELWVGGFERTGWEYDAVGELGLLDRSTEYNYSGSTQYPYVIDVVGYDARNRPTGTSYTIPLQPGLTNGLNGTYTFLQTLDSADQPNSLTYPSVADLVGAETVWTQYWSTGQPRQLGGWEWYVRDTSYNYDGSLNARVYGPANPDGSPNPFQVVRGVEWNGVTGRVERLTAARRSGQVFQSDRMFYDAAGTVMAVSHNPDGTTSDHTECFGYDGRLRLVRAFTTSVVDNCAGGYNGLGPNPMNQFYAVDEIGNLTSGPAGTYSYNASGASSVRPHAPTSVGSTSFGYDSAGRRVSSTTGGVSTSYVWNVPGDRLVAVDRAGVRLESMVYGPDGSRLVRQTASGTTLYLGGLVEISRTMAGVTTAKRFYSFAGSSVAVRSFGDVRFVVGNHQGSTVASASAYSTSIEYQQYQPYGAKRGGDTLVATDRGFVGQTEDDSIGLDYLNNRYHDPTIGQFVSVDPLVQATGEPYSYGSANPTTLSDPTGLCADAVWGFYDDGKGACENGNEVQNHYVNMPTLPGWDNYPDASDDDLARQFYYAWSNGGSNGGNYWDPYGRGLCVGSPACERAYVYYARMGDIGGAKTVAMFYCARNADACASAETTDYWAGVVDTIVLGTIMALAELRFRPCTAGGGNSFVRSTGVQMADGRVEPIEQVEIGDYVFAMDPFTGRGGPRRVTDTITGGGRKDLVQIETAGATVTSTAHHPFWVDSRAAWIDAEDLVVGDELLGAAGDLVEIDSISRRSVPHQIVYNLTVEDLHTFFVTIDDTTTLVHNCGNNYNPARRSLDDLESLRGATSAEVQGMIPSGWVKSATKASEGGLGVRYSNPARLGEQIRIMPGKPTDPNLIKQGPYVRVSRNGVVTDPIPLSGNPAL